MFEKIKTFATVISLIFTGSILGYVISLLCRSKTDRRGSTGDAERNQSIQSGINRTEEHLQRAEDILRGAIRRSTEGNKEIQDNNSC